MDKRLEGKVALVTGAGYGIGRAIALRLAAEGAGVGLIDWNADSAEETAGLVRAQGGRARVEQCDIRSGEMVEGAIAHLAAELGPAEILVNNAGGMIGDLSRQRLRDRFLEESEEEGIHLALDVNLTGTIFVTRAALGGMLGLGRGKIISIASVAGVNGIAGMSIYSAAKGGVIAFTRALAMELGTRRITVNCISPGSILTHGGSPDTFLGRVGQPEEVAGLTAYLAAEESDFITGQNHIIDGGRTLSMRCYDVR